MNRSNSVSSGNRGRTRAANDVTRAIDAQRINAPQYGMVGKHPGFDPSNKPKSRTKRENGNKSSSSDVRKLPTRDLKTARNILSEMIALMDEGSLDMSRPAADAMRSRLGLMNQEMAHRDARDAAKGTTEEQTVWQNMPRLNRRAA